MDNPKPSSAQTEVQLRLLSRAIAQSPVSVVITNLKGEIEYVNPKFTQVTGYSFEEVKGQNPRILKSGSTPPEIYRQLWETIIAGNEWCGELINRKKNGEQYWESASISGVMDASGLVTHFVAVKEDITERKRIETGLRESEERFRGILETAPVAYLLLDQNGGIVFVNADLCRLLTCERALIIGRSFADFCIPESRPRFLQFFETLKEKGHHQTDLTIRSSRGSEIIVSLEGSLQSEGQDGGLRVHCTLFNITERQQLQERLQQQNQSLSALHQSALEFLQHRNLGPLFQSLVEQVTLLLDTSYGELITFQGSDLMVCAATRENAARVGQRLQRGRAWLTWQAIDTHEPAVIDDYAQWQDRNPSLEERQLHAVMALPILNGKECLGVIGLGRTTPDLPFTPDQIHVGRLFAQIAALAIENAKLQATLVDQSIRDPLTGLFNRRYLFETLQKEVVRARRESYPVSFILLDIDHFKQINDGYGHGAGDMALRALAIHLQGMVRASDILCRYGGDEHIIVMPKTSAQDARSRAEQIRLAVADLRPVYQATPLPFTISLGVASFPDHGASADDAITRADQALYQAKNNGRNQVCLYGS